MSINILNVNISINGHAFNIILLLFLIYINVRNALICLSQANIELIVIENI